MHEPLEPFETCMIAEQVGRICEKPQSTGSGEGEWPEMTVV